MKKLLSTVTLLMLFTAAFSQSKLDNLTNNPYKKDGHFVGKVSGKGNGFASFEVVFDFWGLFGEPLSMYYFKWTRPQNFGSISTNCYLNTISKDPKLEKIYNRITPMPDLKVALKITLRTGTTSIATVYHTANIDLPDPAGKFNIFSLPSTNDWIEMFRPQDYSKRIHVAGDRSYDNADKLRSLYSARDKEGYAKLIQSLFKQADNMVVALADDKPVTNLKWPEYDFKLLREACTSRPAAAKKTTPAAELDDLLNSTGYSEKDRAGKGTDRADAVYSKVKDYKDKATLTEARRLYAQTTANPETAAYAKEQIVRIDKLLNYKEPNITGGDWVEINGVKWATRNVGERGRFVEKPEDYGSYYTFDEAQTVCPAGYRLPTKTELESLSKSGNQWGKHNGVNGYLFGSGSNTIFLPAAGYDAQNRVGSFGYYWSITPYGATRSYTLVFSIAALTPSIDNPRKYRFTVRCVKDK